MINPLFVAEAANSGTKMNIGDAAIVAIFGYAVVFFGLILLMIVLYITGAYFKSHDAKVVAKTKSEAVENVTPAVVDANIPPAPGSAGHVKLHGVPDKEAAMIMAITAEKLKTPLNELRFISIKEIK